MPVQLGNAVGKVVLDSSGVRAGVTSAQAQLRALEGTFNAVKVGIAAAGVAIVGSVAGLGAGAVKMAADFDRAMRNVNSIAKLPEGNFKALEGQVISLSTKLPQSAETLAKGLYDIQSSGFAGADALTVLEVSARAASAGLTTTDVASKAVTAVLNAYGMSADQAGHVSDVLFKTVDRGVLTFEELATNVGDIVGTANVAGVSIEDLGAALATMTKGGISAAEASTALNQLMLTYIQPSDDAKDLAQKLGIEFSVQALQAKGLSGAMAELADKVGLYEVVATGADDKIKAQAQNIDAQIVALKQQALAVKGSDEAAKAQKKSLSEQIEQLRLQKTQLLAAKDTNIDYNVVIAEMSQRSGIAAEQLAELFPNVRALKAALSLTRGEGKAFAEELEAMGQASGATQRAFDEQAKATTFQFDLLKNKISAALIRVGTAVLPILNKVMAQIANALDSPQVQRAIDTLLGVIEALGAGNLQGALSKLFGAEGAGQIMGTLQQVTAFVQTQVLPLLQQWIAWVLNVAIPALLAFAGEIGAKFGPVFTEIWSLLTTRLIPDFQRFAAEVMPQIANGVRLIADIVLPALAGALRFVSENWETFRVVLAVIGAVLLALNAPIAAIIAAVVLLATAWANNWGGIQEKTQAVLTFIQNLITTVISAIQQFWTEHGAQILAAWSAVWNAIVTAVERVLGIVRPLLEAFMAALSGDWHLFGEKLREAWDAAWKLQFEIMENAKRILLDLAGKIVAGIVEFFTKTDWGAVGQGIIDGIVNALKAGITAIEEAAKAVAGAALEAAKGFLGIQSPSSVFRDQVGGNIIEGIQDGIDAKMPQIQDALKGLLVNLPIGVNPTVNGVAGGGVGAGGGAGAMQISIPFKLMLGNELLDERILNVTYDGVQRVFQEAVVQVQGGAA